MKILIVTLLLALFAYEASACSCSKEVLMADDHMQSFAINHYGPAARITEENTTWVKYYPTFAERHLMGELRGSSCEGEGPQGERMYMCVNRFKGDFLIKFPELNCEVLLQVVSTYTKVKVKELKSSCKSL